MSFPMQDLQDNFPKDAALNPILLHLEPCELYGNGKEKKKKAKKQKPKSLLESSKGN